MIWRNIVALLGAWTLVWFCYKGVSSYVWVHDSLLLGNYKLIREYKGLSVDERREMKMGFPFRYMKFVRDQTPDTAVILMPAREVYFPQGEKSDFGDADVSNKLWRLRVLYPRRLVDEPELGVNIYSDSITHVAVVNGWGYDHLGYEVAERLKYTVLPVKR
ncbi:MAG: hypothetical protein LBU03_03675 [Tannerellaceae bacterium]|jgi:hypothetical protein|nr:hypothetical protein [Tannerellaceae bacterium]